MESRVHRPLKFIVFNANVIAIRKHELNKQLQNLHVDVALFLETKIS
jgi:hypothetical protein